MTWRPDQPCEGFWMLKCCRLCPFVAARIWLAHTVADPVSGEPMQRSPFLAAQIGLDIVDWRRVWECVEYLESPPGQRHQLATPPLSTRMPRSGRAPALTYAPMPKWQWDRARRITEAQYAAEVEWLSWASRNAPTHCDFTYRKPVARAAAPIPRFA